MIFAKYFSEVSEGIQFLIAFASLMGFLGLITGCVLFLIGGRFSKRYAYTLIIVSLVLVFMTGLYTGVKYFKI